MEEYLRTVGSIPSYVNSSVQTSQRVFSSTLKDGDIFTAANNVYDAYDQDVALLPTMTWIDFMSQVGGLLGLCIGVSIVTIIELVWLCLRLLFQKFKLTHIIT